MRSKWFLKPLVVTITTTYCVTPLFLSTSCSNQIRKHVPTITSLDTKIALYHELVENEQGELMYIVSLKPAEKIYLFNGSQVPYVDIDYYVQNKMQFKKVIGKHGHNYKSVTNNNRTTITNLYSYGTAIIDYSAQTITFPDFDSYINHFYDSENHLAVGAAGGEDYLFPLENSLYVPPTNDLVIDLSYYHIPIYTQDNHGYLPWSLIHNILDPEPEGSWIWTGNDFYQPGPNSLQTVSLYSELRKNATVFTKEYMEFGYNLLALSIDTRWGLPERWMYSEGHPAGQGEGHIFHPFFPNGAYEALKPYHDEIVSLSPNTSVHGLKRFFNEQCDDGGHSGYTSLNLLSTEPLQSGFGPEFSYMASVRSMMRSARAQEGHALDENEIARIEFESSPEAEKAGRKDIAWVTMDSFVEPTHHISYDAVTEDNYKDDTVSLTMYLQKQVNAEDRKIKTVVLDLSNNGGGTVWTEYFLASYLCGGVNVVMENPITNSYGEFKVKAKVDGDSEFTDKDKLPDDVKLYIIASNFTFSCGNALACHIEDNKPDAHLIGDWTGGGSSFVLGNQETILGSTYRCSSNYHMLRSKSSYQDRITSEDGVEADLHHHIDCNYICAPRFYNRPDLIKMMFTKQ